MAIGSTFYKFYAKYMVCIIILLSFVHLNAQAVSPSNEKISLEIERKTMNFIFKEIHKQANVVFMYNNDELDDKKTFSIHFKKQPLDEVLAKIFFNTDFTWQYSDNVVILKKRTTNEDKFGIALDSLITISGVLMTEKKEPIPGATVIIKGTKHGTLSDENGRFILDGVSKKSIIIISSIGFTTMEITSSSISKLSSIILKPYVEILDEKIITAYSSTTLRTDGGGVSVLRSKDIEKKPITNPLLALQGEIPGVVVEQVNGVANGGVKVQIRGQISMGSGNDPFYVIDGVPYLSQVLPSLTPYLGAIQGQNSSPMSFINIADIESITVLKDADATSIYGSRAASGAILITTKKGKEGPTRLNFNFQSGWSSLGRRLKLMDAKQYLEMRHEAKANEGAAILPTDYDLNGTWDTTQSKDWQKELISGTAHYSDYQLSASGGSSNTQFQIGGGYHKEFSIFSSKLYNQKASLHLNLNSNSSNQKFKISFTGNYMVDDNKVPSRDITNIATSLSPVAPNLYNSDGTLNWAPRADGVSTWVNPLSYFLNTSNLRTYNIINNVQLSYQILPSLNIKMSSGYNFMQVNEYNLVPLESTRPERRASTPRYSVFNNASTSSWILEPQVNYSLHLGKGLIQTLVGSTIQQNNSTLQQYLAVGFSSNLVMRDITAASSIQANGSQDNVYRYNALFGNVNYNLKSRYIVNLSGRRDGSSRFGSDNQFHNFWSVAGAWIFSSEPVVEKANLPMTFGKLRASYGTTGNDQIGEYSFLSLYSQYSVPNPYQGVVGLQINKLPNPHLQWEETRKLQLGLDLGFFKNQLLLFKLDYYRNRSSNQLLNYNLPIMTGFRSIIRNFPAVVQNSGWELTINSTNISTEKFSWTSSFNISAPRNKLVAFPGIENSSYASSYIIGQPLGTIRAFHYVGVDKQTGIYQFSDSEGKLTSSPSFEKDANTLISTMVKYYGGLQNSLNYKGFQLDILFQFVNQKSQDYLFGSSPGKFNVNQPINILNRWKNVGDVTDVQKYSSNTGGDVATAYIAAVNSDKGIKDGSFIRWKNISLSWQLPTSWNQSARLQSCRVYLHAQNLLTITKYKNLDPETRSSAFLPPLRTIVAGIQVVL